MLKFLVIIFSTLLNKCAVQGNTGCRSYGIRNSNESYEGSSSTWLGEDGYEGYLEICISMQWRPVCGGEDWTNRVAMVACNQLGYPNTTAIAITGLCSTPPAEISDSVEVSCSSTQTRVEDCSSSVITNCNKWGGVICTSLAFCSEQICSNTSYCHPSSTCTNCSIPSELNCICYAECQTPCSNGGSCSYNNTCQCTPNWTGPDCSQSLLSMTTGSTMTSENSTVTVNTCHVNCLNGGSCSTNGSCTCPPDYSGPICEVKKDTNNSILYLIIYILAALLLLTLLITVGTVLTLILRKLSKKKGKKELSALQDEDEEGYLKMSMTTQANISYEKHRAEQQSQENVTAESNQEDDICQNTEEQNENKTSGVETLNNFCLKEPIYSYDRLLKKEEVEDHYYTNPDQDMTTEEGDQGIEIYSSLTSHSQDCTDGIPDGYSVIPTEKIVRPVEHKEKSALTANISYHEYYQLEKLNMGSNYMNMANFEEYSVIPAETNVKREAKVKLATADKSQDARNSDETKEENKNKSSVASYYNIASNEGIPKQLKLETRVIGGQSEHEYYEFGKSTPNDDLPNSPHCHAEDNETAYVNA